MRRLLVLILILVLLFLIIQNRSVEMTEVRPKQPVEMTGESNPSLPLWTLSLPVSTSTTEIPATTTTTSTPPTTTTTTSAPLPKIITEDVWDRMANCESSGRWWIDGLFDGGLQFDPYIWTAYVAEGKPYGLIGYPEYAYQATREQQIVVAIRVRDGVKGSSDPYLNAQGWNAWPTCRYKIGV